jgi:hypothetical protein
VLHIQECIGFYENKDDDDDDETFEKRQHGQVFGRYISGYF